MDAINFPPPSCSSSSSSSSSTSNPSPPLPLRNRFQDFPEPVRTHIIDASVQIIDYHLRFTENRIQRHGRYRCRGCNEKLRRIVKAAEDAGLEVEEEYRSMVAKVRTPWDVELAEWWDRVKRQREEGEDEREFKRGRTSFLEEGEEEEEEDVDVVDDVDGDDDDREILEIHD